MLVGGVIQHQLNDDADSAVMGRFQKRLEIIERAVVWVDGVVVRDVVAIVAQRGGKERHEPEGVDAQILQVVQLLHQPGKIADAVVIAVAERADVQLINDGVFVPKRLGCDQPLTRLSSDGFDSYLRQARQPMPRQTHSLTQLQNMRRQCEGSSST